MLHGRAWRCCSSASRSRSPRRRSTCGRPTSTTARRRRSPRSWRPSVKTAAFAAFARVMVEALGRRPRALASGALVAGRAHDGGRQRARAVAEEHHAHARVLEHRARRLPAGRDHRRLRRGRQRRSCSTRCRTRWRRSARSRCWSRSTTGATSRRRSTTSPDSGRVAPGLAIGDGRVPARASSACRWSAAWASSPSGTCCRPRSRRRRRRPCSPSSSCSPASSRRATISSVISAMFMRPRPDGAAGAVASPPLTQGIDRGHRRRCCSRSASIPTPVARWPRRDASRSLAPRSAGRRGASARPPSEHGQSRDAA